MVGLIASFIFLIVALSGYYYGIKPSKLEKEIRKKKLDYECFECKEKFSVNELKCPKCSFITLYGKRRSKYWTILPILGFYMFMVAKWVRQGVIS